MKTTHLLFIGMIAAFSSCSTAYRSGQTPDDVYYSPAPTAVETYVTSDNQQDRNAYGYNDDEDQDIRRGIQDPRYRNNLSSNFSIGLGSGYGYNPYLYSPYGGGYGGYGYDPYGYSSFGYKGMYDPYGYGYNSYYSPYYSGIGYGGGYGGGFGGYYSPIYSYYPGIGSISTNTNVAPRRVNLAAFNSATANRINQANQGTVSGTHPSSMPVRAFGIRPGQSGTIERQQGSGVGNVIRRVFTPSESRTAPNNSRSFDNSNNQSSRNDNRTYTPPARTFDNTPSSNTSSSPAPSSSNSAPVRTFRK
jgi:hypothetical protein